MSFIFGGDTDLTYEQIQRRRQIAQSLAPRGASRNVGEGISNAARMISGALINRKADRAEERGRSAADNIFQSLFQSGQGTPTAPPTSASVPAVETQPLMTPEQSVGADTRAALGYESAMPESLIGTESGGNFSALNNEVGHGGVAGHGGRGQFGHARLQDAAAAGVIPEGTTPQQFAQMDPQTQVAVENWHMADIDRAIDQSGAIGTVVNGVPLTRDALRSVAHLGGIGGMNQFVATKGEYNPADSFGTSLSDYAQTHGGGHPAQATQGGQQPQSGPTIQQLMEAAQNPFMRPEQRQIVSMLLGQQMQAQDPMRQMEMERQRLELEAMRNPQPGYSVLSADEASSMGLTGGSYQRGPDGRITKIGGGGVNVTVGPNGEPQAQIGTIPPGYQAVPDGAGGYTMSPIPGSEAAAEAQQAEEKVDLGAESQAAGSVNVLEVLDNLRTDVEENPNTTTGFLGRLLSNVAGTKAYDAEATAETLKANLAFDALAAMRAASPTGGALGAVSERELGLLESQIGSLDLGQSREQLMANIERIENQYTRILNKAYETGDPQRLDAVFGGRPDFVQIGGQSPSQPQTASAPPEGIEQNVWDVMTPEEKALWAN